VEESAPAEGGVPGIHGEHGEHGSRGSGGDDDAAEVPVLPDDVVDQLDPLLTFDEGGDPVGPVLPDEPVWVLHPEDRTLASDVPPRVLVTSRPPLTWRGWRLAQLDLRGVSWIGLEESPRRVVRGRTKPVLRTGPPLPGITVSGSTGSGSTVPGRPVYAAPPTVLLPPGPGHWRIVVRRARTGAVLADVTVPGGTASDALWSRVPRPVLGELVITVTAAGRAGRAAPGLRRVVTVAEGLALTCHPRIRLTSDTGLEPAEALLTAPPGMTVSPTAVPFGELAARKDVTCVVGPVTQRLAVTPPHLRLRVEPEPGSGGSPGPWHYAGPLPLTTDDLWHGGALRLDLPGTDRLPSLEVIPENPGSAPDSDPERASDPGTGTGAGAGKPAQVLEPTRQGLYPLRRMLDTVRARGTANLVITVWDSRPGGGTPGPRRAVIARVSADGAYADQWAIDAGQ
jgi:hypothetical protein